MTPETEKAFRLLRITPDANPASIRAAWKAMVRRYHPDKVKDNKADANRRLADLNAAFDLISSWTAEDAQAYVAARAKCRAAQHAAFVKAQAKRRDAEHRAQQQQQRRAAARSALQELARQRAAELDRRDAAKRSARSHAVRARSPKALTPHDKLLSALRDLGPITPSSDLGFL